VCKFLTNKKAQELIAKVEDPFKQLPHLPQSITDFFVKIVPWGAALGGIFSVTGAITNFRLGFGMNTVGRVMRHYLGVNSAYFLLSAVIMLVLAFLAFKAFTPLRERKIEGWIYIFWSNIVSVIHSILGLIFISQSAIGSIVGVLIGFYLLFEIKASYEKKATKTATAKK